MEETLLSNDGKPDIEKESPIVFAPEIRKYYGVGQMIDPAYDIGKQLNTPLK